MKVYRTGGSLFSENTNNNVAPDQNPATLSRSPVNTLPLREDVAVPALRMAALICAAVAPEFRALYSATAPETCGVAIDVPLHDAYPPGTVDQMACPGAPMSTENGP